MFQKLRRLNVLTPSVLQSYVWPAMLRGRSFAAISSPHSGKTLAYLCPLLTFLLEKSQYVDLPSGNEVHMNNGFVLFWGFFSNLLYLVELQLAIQ